MSFYHDLAGLNSHDKEARLALAKAYVCAEYGIDPQRFVTPEQGDQNFVFLDPAQKSVIRLGQHPGMREAMEGEVAVMKAMQDHTAIPIPIVTDFQPEKTLMRTSLIPGSHLSMGRLAALTRSERRAVAERIGAFIARMHMAFPVKAEVDVPWRLDARIGLNHLQMSELESGKRELIEAAKDCLEGYGTKTHGDCVMSHTDLNKGNILYADQGRKLGVIDFTASKYAPRYRDFFRLQSVLPPAELDQAIRVYERITGAAIDRGHMKNFGPIFKVMTEKYRPNARPVQAHPGKNHG